MAFVGFVLVADMRIAVRDLGSFWDRAALRTGYLLRTGPIRSRELLDKELYRVADYNLDANRLVALEVTRRTPPGAKIFVWGFEPGIYWMADRPPATRYVYDVAQRVSWGRERAQRELMADLAKNPPALAVVQHGDRFSWVTGDDFDSAEALPHFHDLARLVERDFQLVTTIEDFDVYERRPAPGSTEPRPRPLVARPRVLPGELEARAHAGLARHRRDLVGHRGGTPARDASPEGDCGLL